MMDSGSNNNKKSRSMAAVGMGCSISLMFFLLVAATTTPQMAAHAQEQLPIQKPTIDPATNVFTDTQTAFKVTVPTGWVVEDLNTTAMVLVEAQLGYGILAIFCPQEQALPAIGGRYNCEDADDQVVVYRDLLLGSNPEFAQVGDPTKITLDDYIAYELSSVRNRGVSGIGNFENIQIVNTTDKTINIAPDNITKVPAKLLEMTYTGTVTSQENRAYTLLTLVSIDLRPGGTIIITEGTPAAADAAAKGMPKTGYRVTYEGPAALTPTGRLPNPAVAQIFDTFQFFRQ